MKFKLYRASGEPVFGVTGITEAEVEIDSPEELKDLSKRLDCAELILGFGQERNPIYSSLRYLH